MTLQFDDVTVKAIYCFTGKKVVGCTPVGLSASLCLIVSHVQGTVISHAFFVNMCRPARETFQPFCRNWTNSPNRGCGCARIRQMYINVYLVKMVSFLSVMFANPSVFAPFPKAVSAVLKLVTRAQMFERRLALIQG